MHWRSHSDVPLGWQLMNNDVCVRTSGHMPNITPALSQNGPLPLRWCYVRFHDYKSETLSHQIVVMAKVVWEGMERNIFNHGSISVNPNCCPLQAERFTQLVTKWLFCFLRNGDTLGFNINSFLIGWISTLVVTMLYLGSIGIMCKPLSLTLWLLHLEADFSSTVLSWM